MPKGLKALLWFALAVLVVRWGWAEYQHAINKGRIEHAELAEVGFKARADSAAVIADSLRMMRDKHKAEAAEAADSVTVLTSALERLERRSTEHIEVLSDSAFLVAQVIRRDLELYRPALLPAFNLYVKHRDGIDVENESRISNRDILILGHVLKTAKDSLLILNLEGTVAADAIQIGSLRDAIATADDQIEFWKKEASPSLLKIGVGSVLPAIGALVIGLAIGSAAP